MSDVDQQPSFTDVIGSWDERGASDDASQAIHPTGGDPRAYERSGADMAAYIDTKIQQLLRIGRGPAATTVLDFGCGDGRVTLPLARDFGYRMIGADASRSMLDRFEKRIEGRNIPAVLSMGADLNAALKQAQLAPPDVIFAVAVLIHHSHADVEQIVAGLTRAVAPGGYLMLGMPLYDEPRERSSWCDVSTWTFAEVAAIARANDLAFVHARTSPGTFSFEEIGEHHSELTILRTPLPR
jgi:SAM-dependent methyltransferase